MPIFDYECESCGFKVLDVFQRINDDALVYCPECNEPRLRKQVGVSNFILKGEGWYAPSKTDNDK